MLKKVVFRITANLLVMAPHANGGIISNHLLYGAQGKKLKLQNHAILN
jgi:hypothetical protein